MDANTITWWSSGYCVSSRYRLETILGQGGFAQVWRATDLVLSRTVALKVLHPTLTLADKTRFVREAHILANINTPSIVAVYDAGIDSGRAFLVMEFVDGITLARLIKKGPIPFALVFHLAVQIGKGIEHLHRQKIVHQDIKPGNILISQIPKESLLGKKWSVKVSDFGLAKLIETGLRKQTASRPGLMAGTLPYMAPELITDSTFGTSNDIFAFGVTLFQMLTGRLPFPETDIAGIFRRRDQQPPDPSLVNPGIPTQVAELVRQMLSPKPSLRPKSAGEVADFFQSLSASYPLTDWQPEEDLASDSVNKTELSFLSNARPPTGFFARATLRESMYFGDDSVRFKKIEDTLRFYRDHLNNDYETLMRQARTTYRLWACCVALGALTLLAGVIAMLAGHVTEGLATSAATIIVYFIQKVFQLREDFYRASAAVKAQHLEYGNHWILVIQSIDAIRDPQQQTKRQAKLVDVLLRKLKRSPGRSFGPPDNCVEGGDLSQ